MTDFTGCPQLVNTYEGADFKLQHLQLRSGHVKVKVGDCEHVHILSPSK